MFKFFRKIRYDLLQKNKTGKYLKYAIGEIILVVIGILIALQINTWNQHRLDLKEKKELLSKLHSEFKSNKEILINNRNQENKAISSGVALMNLIGASENELLAHNLDSLLFESFPPNELAFSNNAVNNILQNGRLKLFENTSINELLNQWISLEEIRKTRIEKLDSWSDEQLLPYLLDYISFKEMDSNAGFEWTGTSKVKPNYYPLFQSVKFENLLDNSLWLHQNIVERLNETEALVDEIINATNPEKLK